MPAHNRRQAFPSQDRRAIGGFLEAAILEGGMTMAFMLGKVWQSERWSVMAPLRQEQRAKRQVVCEAEKPSCFGSH